MIEKFIRNGILNWKFWALLVPVGLIYITCVVLLFVGVVFESIGKNIVKIVHEVNHSDRLRKIVKWMDN